jgi:hypothetical protein
VKNYFEIIPQHEVAQLLNALRNRCTHERKTPNVRAALAEGLGVILEEAETHPTISAILPDTRNLLHDRSPLVRASFVNLLKVIGQCRAIHTHDIVPHEELFVQLVIEHALSQAERVEKEIAQAGSKRGNSTVVATDVVIERLTKLMVPSLFHVSVPEQVQRCHDLLQKYPLALLSLLSNAGFGEVIPLADRVKLAVGLFQQGRKALQKALEAQAQPSGRQPLVIDLQVAGLLFAGIPTAANQRRKRRGSKETKEKEEVFPPELDRFVKMSFCAHSAACP